MRAVVTPGNRYDSPFLPKLIADLDADYVLADAGYDSKTNYRAVKDIDAEPVIASNLDEGNARRSSMLNS